MAERNGVPVNQAAPETVAEAGSEEPAPKPNNNKGNGKPSNAPKYLQMLGVITVESGVGFAAGFALGKKGKGQIGAVIGAIIALSVVFGLEFWLRYINAKPLLLVAGIISLMIAGIVPYVAMSKGGKGKAKDESAYLPTVAASWSVVAIAFGLICAKMSGGKIPVADALQGIILSLLYAGVTSASGYGVGTGAGKSVTTKLAMAMWGALVLFDMAGLARDAPAANVPSEPAFTAST